MMACHSHPTSLYLGCPRNLWWPDVVLWIWQQLPWPKTRRLGRLGLAYPWFWRWATCEVLAALALPPCDHVFYPFDNPGSNATPLFEDLQMPNFAGNCDLFCWAESELCLLISCVSFQVSELAPTWYSFSGRLKILKSFKQLWRGVNVSDGCQPINSTREINQAPNKPKS